MPSHWMEFRLIICIEKLETFRHYTKTKQKSNNTASMIISHCKITLLGLYKLIQSIDW